MNLLRKERRERYELALRDLLEESSTDDEGGEKVLRHPGGMMKNFPTPGRGRYAAEMSLKSMSCLEEGRGEGRSQSRCSGNGHRPRCCPWHEDRQE